MTHARWQLVLALLLLAAWSAWLPAAWRSHADAMDYVAECHSIDAHNQLRIARLILGGVLLGSGLSLLLLVVRKRWPANLWWLGTSLAFVFAVACLACIGIGLQVVFLFYGAAVLYGILVVVTLVRPLACTPRRQPVSRRAGDAAAACAETQSDEPAGR